MKAFKPAIITGTIALIAVIVTIIVITTGNASYGLYISSVSGNVNISNPNSGISEDAAIDRKLELGDVITVNEGGSCTIIYRTRDNFDENYAVLEPSTQIFVTGEFNSKGDSEIYLNRGAVLVSSLEKAKSNIIVRTENSSVTTKEAAIRVQYETGEEKSTNVASFGGNSAIQLYSIVGSPVDRDGNPAELPEYLGSGLCGKIITNGENMPRFDFLNLPVELSSFKASTLKELLTISAFHELAFSAQDIKAAYDAAPSETSEPDAAESETEPVVTEVTDFIETVETVTVPSETEAVSETEISEETTTAEEITTTTQYTTTQYTTTQAYTTTTPYTTTQAYTTTTTAAQTTAAQTTAMTEDNDDGLIVDGGDDDGELIEVYIIIDDEIIVEEVPYGGSVPKPADPVVEGKIFKGWDASFDNITGETTISAIFEDVEETTAFTTAATTASTTASTTSAMSYTVSFNINGVITSQTVPYGGSAVPPAVNVPGYTFTGWDRSTSNITGDTIITAILVPDASFSTTYTVTFIIDGMSYPVSVKAGENAVPPIIPVSNSAGQTFLGWDSNLNSVSSNMTVNAIYG